MARFRQFQQRVLTLKCCTRIIVATGIITLIIYVVLSNGLEFLKKTRPQPQLSRFYKSEIIWKEGPCQIPKLNPFDESIRHLVDVENEVDCTVRHPKIFGSDLNSHLIVLNDPKILGYEDCCYTPFYRNSDKNETFANSCIALSGNSTRIPTEHEFIAVYCWETVYSITGFLKWLLNLNTLVDMFSFIHADSPKNIKKTKHAEHSPNIVILGIDTLSATHFVRTMPRSYSYLLKNLSAIGMEGYSMFKERTLDNLVPVLTGMNLEELETSCWPDWSSHFDACKFLWQAFSSQGYVTSYAEDNTEMGLFLYGKQGFKSQPTDYYFIPLFNAFRTNKLQHFGNGSRNVPVCYGPRLGFSLLLSNMKEMALVMGDRKYFQFTWATSICHENPDYGGAGDNLLFDLLRWFKVEGRLESTIFIIMSDHGARFGEFRETEYGRIDVKMPFLYFLFPSWFSKKYQLAVQNVGQNYNKLTTPFDLHETLKDLLDLGSIEDTSIKSRQERLKNLTKIPRGMSLFLSLPDISQRKCAEAEIPLQFCFCSTPFPISVKKPEVRSAARSAITFINQQLNPYPQCAILVLDKIISAHRIYGSIEDAPHPSKSNDTLNSSSTFKRNSTSTNHGVSGSLILLIKFQTLPSNAIFETTIVEISNTEWALSGDISRINKYGDQSRCVADLNLKNFCFCN